MKPENLQTKIFLDSGDPGETKEMLDTLGFLDGQTTNPTLVSKHPEAKQKLEAGAKFSTEEIYGFYKEIVQEISELIPDGSVSIEVYADHSTSTADMLAQARYMYEWIPNAHIKFPTTSAGLTAARQFHQEGGRVNMTLCFTQEQAAAVHAAMEGAQKGDVFVSPFIGRLDDRGENGMDLIRNCNRMLHTDEQRVEVLTASVRSLEHIKAALAMQSDSLTAPIELLREWAEAEMPVPDAKRYEYDSGDLESIAYTDLNLHQDWTEFDLSHDLTERGIEKFSDDWNKLVQ